jgi:hypothetical protein
MEYNDKQSCSMAKDVFGLRIIIISKNKILTPLFFFPLLSGILYGIFFDLINYTIAEEYFTKNIFKETYVPEALHNKWGTVITGIMENWWIGILPFIMLVPFLLIQKNPKGRIKPVIISTIVFILVSLIVPLIPPSFDLFIIWFSHVPYESFTIHYNKSAPESEHIHNVIGFFFVSAIRDLKYLGLMSGCIISLTVQLFLQSKNRAVI